MRLIDVVNAPWAITQEMHDEVQAIYSRHMRGDKIDLSALEARTGLPLKNAQTPMSVSEDGVAVVCMEGVLAKKMNLFSAISGGTSTQMIGAQLAQAEQDPSVTQIVLYVDSPGGTVDGTQQLAAQIEAMTKPVIAVVDGMCCSAAYWIASACDAIYITSDTAQVGSIGVIASHVDKSMAQAQAGYRVTEVTAGKYKGQGSPNAPLGMGEATMQDAVDQIYAVFTADVARNRGMTAEQMQAAAEGRVFMGNSAIKAGLVDGVSTFEAVIAKAAGSTPASFNAEGAGVVPQASQTTEEDMSLTIEKVKAEAPAIAEALIAEGKTGYAEAVKTASAEAVAAERSRLVAIDAVSMPGCEKLTAECKADGSSAEAYAVKALAFLKAKQSKALADHQADAAAVAVAAAVAPETTKPTEQKGPDMAVVAKAQAYVEAQAQAGVTVSTVDAIAHVRKTLTV